jgi:hypothetical protein
MALCVVGFDGYFLNNPTQCFFSSSCSLYIYSSYGYVFTYDTYGLTNTTTLYSVKVPLIKGQLAAGVLMFVSCVFYIVIFAVSNYRVNKVTVFQSDPSMPVTIVHPPPPYGSLYANPINGKPVDEIPVIPSSAMAPAIPPYQPPTEPPTSSVATKHQLICPNCRSRFQVSA